MIRSITGLLLCFFTVVEAAIPPHLKARPLSYSHQVNLSERYEGDVILIVNTPAYCKGESQFDGLQALYQRYRDKGFVVLGFPTTDFKSRERSGEQSFLDECRKYHNLSFPMFSVSRVRGEEAHSIFQWLSGEGQGNYPRENFTKFLIGRDGRLVRMFPQNIRPDDMKLAVEINKQLKRKKAESGSGSRGP